MNYYIGIDGGGTKTAIAIGKEDGKIIKSIEKPSCSYKSIGIDATVALLKESVDEILEAVGAKRSDCKGLCIGLPCYGEDPEKDPIVAQKIKDALSPVAVHIVNDAVVGWAGSLGCCEGIHIVAGTGAITYACTSDGKEARSNGWSEFFSDEGSCYWVGKQAMSLFAKESDLRRPRGALYDIVKEKLNLKNDIDFIGIIENEYAPFRHKVASFQLFAMEAALKGDEEAKKIYAEAAGHLADSAKGIIAQFGWEDRNVPVSYYGGLFKTGDLILGPLKENLKKINCTLHAPKHGALEGALLLSIKIFK